MEYLDVKPEVTLWRNVLILFFRDIVHLRWRLKNASNGRCQKIIDELEVMRDTAKSDWLKDVCGFAGKDYDRFLDRTIKAIDGEIVLNMTYRRPD